MLWLLVLLFLLAVFLIFAKTTKGRASDDTVFSYAKKTTLFSEAERSFLGVIDSAIGSDFRVLGKVRVADVLEVNATNNRSTSQSAFNKISSKHFDYLVCSKSTLEILCAIELDDKSHEKKARQDRDAFLVSACKTAQLPLVRFEARKSYSVQDVRNQLLQAMGVESSNIIEKIADTPAQEEAGRGDISIAVSNTPVCPKCFAQMVKRQARSGPHEGKIFWACSAYPKCRSIQEIAS